jgi:hypothetical protein
MLEAVPLLKVVHSRLVHNACAYNLAINLFSHRDGKSADIYTRHYGCWCCARSATDRSSFESYCLLPNPAYTIRSADAVTRAGAVSIPNVAKTPSLYGCNNRP